LIPDLAHNFLSTMQLRLNDVTVNDAPRFLTDDPTPLTHSLVIPTDECDKPYVIPMTLHGVASSFPTRKPTVTEYESLPHVILTSEEHVYNPHDTSMAEHENALAKRCGNRGPQRFFAAKAPMFSLQNRSESRRY